MKTTLSKIILFSGVFLLFLGVYIYKHQITIDVIIPVYNSAKFLPRCLDSVFAQSGKFKVIAVNDGSTDNSLQILNQYAQKHKNMIVINQKNQGVSAARNNALKITSGEYITFVDSDDWLESNSFLEIMKVIKKDAPQIVLTGHYDVYDRQWVLDTGGEKALAEISEDETRFPTRQMDKISLFSPFKGENAHSDIFYLESGVKNQVFQREFIEKHNLYFPTNVKCAEDEIFIKRAFLNNPLISILPVPLYNYRNRSDSLSKSSSMIEDSMESLAVFHDSDEYKKANRRTKMLIDDSWSSLTILGISNLQRNGYPWGTGFDKIRKVYDSYKKYNTAELESCRNFKRLQFILFGRELKNPF